MTLETKQASSGARTSEKTPEALALAIKEIARNIRESSAKMRETVHGFHQTGAIDEMADAIRSAAFVARDVAKELEEISNEIKARGVISDTKQAAKDTVAAVQGIEKTIAESFGKKVETTK